MTELYLVRHGEPDWENVGEDHNPGLTGLGRAQAQQLGVWVNERLDIDVLYGSTLNRARETAETVNESLQLDLQLRENLKEWPYMYGVWHVLDNPHSLHSFAHPFADLSDLKKEDVYTEFAERIHKALNEIVKEHQEKRIMIVCHGGVIGQVFRNLTGNHHMPLVSDFTGVSKIYWEDDRWIISYMNRLDHLSQC